MSFDDQQTRRKGSRRRSERREPDLRDAALRSPLLRERWQIGSPLNWLEFITGTRMARPGDVEEDAHSTAAGG